MTFRLILDRIKNMADNRIFYGGQAVIEGVMMRGKQVMAVATRRPNGQIGVQTQPVPSLFKGKWRKFPFVRGVLAFIESLVMGIQTLMYSANVALEEENTKLSGWTTWGIILVAMLFSVGLFFLLPLLIAIPIKNHVPAIVFNLVEGVIRVVIFIAYLKIVSMMKDIQRVFAYHGAEHKAINTFEAGEPLDVEHARKFTTANPRCGTSFLFAVMVIAIIVFSIVGKPGLAWLVASRILLLPVIASLGYEFIYVTSRHCDNPIMKILLTPGLWLQSLTTREPDDQQLEVGLEALKHVVAEEKVEETVSQPMIVSEPLPAE
jgi:uncharacterized protein YqhQ